MNCREGGFSLLEVLLAILLLSTGLVFLLQAVNTGLLTSSYSEDEVIAAYLAQEKSEEILNTTFASISSSTEPSVPGFTKFGRTVNVKNNTPVASSKQVTVAVSWYAQDKPVSLSTVSYVSDV